jgi:uncharacterized protein (DUF952 family)
MRIIYHILPRADWENVADPYRAASLDSEGFIHCSGADQVARVANLFFADCDDLVVLCIDAGRLGSPLRDEDAGTGELFPHVYGPIERAAVLQVMPLTRAPDGRWAFTPYEPRP